MSKHRAGKPNVFKNNNNNFFYSLFFGFNFFFLFSFQSQKVSQSVNRSIGSYGLSFLYIHILLDDWWNWTVLFLYVVFIFSQLLCVCNVKFFFSLWRSLLWTEQLKLKLLTGYLIFVIIFIIYSLWRVIGRCIYIYIYDALNLKLNDNYIS